MSAYSGKFDYLDERGGTVSQGPCQASFDTETCIVTPAAGAPLAFDLGDVDLAAPAEWDLGLTLYTGRTIKLRQFGAAFGRMSQELLAAWRDRTIQCLLLEDLEEVARFNATAALAGGAASPAEIRLYGSNLAILPQAASAFQWRLAEVESVKFDSYSYNLTLQSGAEKLVISKLAKKTEEFREKLGGTLDALHTHSAEVLHATFPFLNPDQLQRLVIAMPEGRSVPLATLAAIHPKLPDALVARAVDAHLKPYFDALRARATGDLMAGFKFIRADEEKDAEAQQEATELAEAGETPPEPGENPQPLFFWFFFQVAPSVVAWEATTGTGRATYFFRVPAGQSASDAVATFTRGLALVNFRREPVYLSDDSLEQQARFHRYAIGARKLPDLRALRQAMMGRAIHTTVEKWGAQMQSIVGK
jgi:hypothetical protein